MVMCYSSWYKSLFKKLDVRFNKYMDYTLTSKGILCRINSNEQFCSVKGFFFNCTYLAYSVVDLRADAVDSLRKYIHF